MLMICFHLLHLRPCCGLHSSLLHPQEKRSVVVKQNLDAFGYSDHKPGLTVCTQATTRRLAGIYPFLKDVALAGVPERPSANQAIFTFCLRLAKEGISNKPNLKWVLEFSAFLSLSPNRVCNLLQLLQVILIYPRKLQKSLSGV